MSLSAAAAGLFLFGCGPRFVTYNQLGELHIKNSRAAVEDVLNMDPSGSFTVYAAGVGGASGPVYEVDYYPLQTGYTETTTTGTTGSYGSLTTTRTKVREYYLNRVLIMYKDGGLRYWGMMADFSKSEDPEVRELAPQIYNANARSAGE